MIASRGVVCFGECALLFPSGGRRNALFSPADWDGGSTAEKPPAGRSFWNVQNGSLSGSFSLTKAPSFAIRNSDCKIHPQRRLNDKGVSSSAELDQQALPAGHPPPFEKGGRKLYLQKLGAALSLAPNRPLEGWAGLCVTAVS